MAYLFDRVLPNVVLVSCFLIIQNISMSVENNNRQELIDAQSVNSSHADAVNPLDNVGWGVIYYWRVVFRTICFNLCSTLLIAFCVIILVMSFPNIPASLQEECKNLFTIFMASILYYFDESKQLKVSPEILFMLRNRVAIVCLIYNLIYFLIIIRPLYKSMINLYKTPSSIHSRATSLLTVSWILYAVYWGIAIFYLYFYWPYPNHIITGASFLVMGGSRIFFLFLLDSIGRKMHPERKGCKPLIILTIASIIINIIVVLVIQNGFKPSSFPLMKYASMFDGVVNLFYLIYIIMLASYFQPILKYGESLQIIPEPVSEPFQQTSPEITDNGDSKEKSKRSLAALALKTFLWFFVCAAVLYILFFLISSYAWRVSPSKKNDGISYVFSRFFNTPKKQQEFKDWNDAFNQLQKGVVSKEVFYQWVEKEYLPSLIKEYNETLSKMDSHVPIAEMLFKSEILQERISYCQDFRKAVHHNSQQLLTKAIRNVYRVDLKSYKAFREKGWASVAVPLSDSEALEMAILADDIDMALWLIDRGIDVNMPNRYKETPIQIAEREKNQRMVEFLKEHGAKVDSQPDNNDNRIKQYPPAPPAKETRIDI